MEKPATPLPRILREGPITPELCDRAAEHIEVQNADLAHLTAINAELVAAGGAMRDAFNVWLAYGKPENGARFDELSVALFDLSYALARAKENSNVD